jgi:hypothetical protein
MERVTWLDTILLTSTAWAIFAALSYRHNYRRIAEDYRSFLESQEKRLTERIERLDRLDSLLHMTGADGTESAVDLKDYDPKKN